MKALPVLLALSFVANAALLTHSTFSSSSSKDTPSAPTHTVSRSPTPRSTTTTAPNDGPPIVLDGQSDFVRALRSGDNRVLRDALLAADLPDEIVRGIISIQLWNRHRDHLKSLQESLYPNQNEQWWITPNHQINSAAARAHQEEMRRLQREMQAELTELLGPASNAQVFHGYDQRLAFLPQEKRALITQIEQDYNELISEINQETGGFQLPSDQEKIRFLEEEKQRDLAAILTPEQLADFELRTSPTANNLRHQLSRFQPTEAEYRAIYALQRDFDEQFGHQRNAGRNQTPDYWAQRREAEKALNQQIRSTLGEERFTDYRLAQDHEFQRLQAAAARASLPPEATRELYGMRDLVTADSRLVAADPSLDLPAKREALKHLAASARERILSTLGPEIGQAYLDQGAMSWINALDNGQSVTIDPDTGRTTNQRLPNR